MLRSFTFTVVTDSNPLTYVLSTAKLDATGYRWLAALSTYDFKLQYKSGKQNVEVDGLSRRLHVKIPTDDLSLKEQTRILDITEQLAMNSGEHEINDDVVKAICDSRLIQWSECPDELPTAFISSLQSRKLLYQTLLHGRISAEDYQPFLIFLLLKFKVLKCSS